MKSLRKSVLISFLDQAILSLMNVSIGVFLIRNTSKDNYGLYVLAYSAILFVVSVQNALITNQMTVIAPRKGGDDRERFCASLASAQYLIFVPIVIGCLLVLGLIEHYKILNAAQLDLAFAVGVASLGVVLREFFRSLFFLKLKPQIVLLIDLIHVGLVFAGLLAARHFFPGNMHTFAILAVGIASAIAGVFGIVVAGIASEKYFSEMSASLSESWKHGKWALGGVIITWLQDQSYVYLLSLLAAPASTAEANAARLFLAPLALLNASIARTMMPRWSYLRHEGDFASLHKTARQAGMLVVSIVIIYVIFLLFFRDRITSIVLTQEYADTGVLITLWGCVFVAQSVRSNQSIVLQVLHKFRALTLLNGASAIIVILSSFVLIKRYGTEGSIIALFIGEVVLAVSMIWVLRRTMKLRNAGSSPTVNQSASKISR